VDDDAGVRMTGVEWALIGWEVGEQNYKVVGK
jgi:hypothetical protein